MGYFEEVVGGFRDKSILDTGAAAVF